MQTLTTSRDINMNHLHDYLIATVVGFHRTEAGVALEDCGGLSQRGDEITIKFADDLDPVVVSQAIDQFVA